MSKTATNKKQTTETSSATKTVIEVVDASNERHTFKGGAGLKFFQDGDSVRIYEGATTLGCFSKYISCKVV